MVVPHSSSFLFSSTASSFVELSQQNHIWPRIPFCFKLQFAVHVAIYLCCISYEICTQVQISVTKWCIMGYLCGALWDLSDGAIVVRTIVLLMTATYRESILLWWICFRYGLKPTKYLYDLYLHGEHSDIQSEVGGNLNVFWKKQAHNHIRIVIPGNQMDSDSTVYMEIEFQSKCNMHETECAFSLNWFRD